MGDTSLDGGLCVVFPFWSGSLALAWNRNLAAWTRGLGPGGKAALVPGGWEAGAGAGGGGAGPWGAAAPAGGAGPWGPMAPAGGAAAAAAAAGG